MELQELSKFTLECEERGRELVAETAWEQIPGFGEVRKNNLPLDPRLTAVERRSRLAQRKRGKTPFYNNYEPLLKAIIKLTGLVPAGIQHSDPVVNFRHGPVVTMPDGTLFIGDITYGESSFCLAVACDCCGVITPHYRAEMGGGRIEHLSDIARYSQDLAPVLHCDPKFGVWYKLPKRYRRGPFSRVHGLSDDGRPLSAIAVG